MSEPALSRAPEVADLTAARRRRAGEVATALSGVALFDGFGEGDLADFAAAFRRIELARHETLWQQGTPADGLYVLLDGEVRVCRRLPGERELELTRLGPGEVMGELPLLGGGTRRATVRAVRPCTVLFLSRAEFEAHAMSGQPRALELRHRIVAIACQRLRRTYSALAATVGPAAPLGAGPHETPPRELVAAGAPPRTYLSRLPLFRALEPDLVAELVGRGKVLAAPRGRVLQHEGVRAKACYVTLNGAVEDVIRRGTAELRVGFTGPGHAFGYLGLLDDGSAPVSSVTRERCVLLAIAGEHFEMLQREPGARSRAFAAAIEADLIRSLEVADRARAHLAEQKLS
jgi:CRP-like cAMP-binding protein